MAKMKMMRRMIWIAALACLLAAPESLGWAAGQNQSAQTPSARTQAVSAVSIDDLFTSAVPLLAPSSGAPQENRASMPPASADPASSAAASPSSGSSRPLSAAGARMLLLDAAQARERGNAEESRAILRDVVSRRPAGDPEAARALLMLAAIAPDDREAEVALQRLADSGAPDAAMAREACTLILERAGRARAQKRLADGERLIGRMSPFLRLAAEPGLKLAFAEARAALWLDAGQSARALDAMLAAEKEAGQEAPSKTSPRAPEASQPPQPSAPPLALGASWLLLRGRCALEARRLGIATESFERLTRQHPDTPESHQALPALGVLYEIQGDPESAGRCYSRYLSEEPSRAAEWPPASAAGLGSSAQWVAERERALRIPFFPPPVAQPPRKN